MKKSLLFIFASFWLSSAGAVPINQSKARDSTADLSAEKPVHSVNVVPQEILDQFGVPQAAGFSQAILAVKSSELREKLTKTPNSAPLMHALGTVTYQMGGAKEALALWDSAQRRDANLAPANVMQDVQDLFGLLAKGDMKAAENLLVTAEKRHANQPHFLLIRAEQAMRSGNTNAAGQAYRRAYELAPKLFVTVLNLARYLDTTKSNEQEADRLFHHATKMAPDRSVVWLNFGEFQFRKGNIKSALESFQRAKKLDSSTPVPEKRLAELSMRAGNYRMARDWLHAALETKPTIKEERELRAALGDVLLRLGFYDEARKEIETVLKVVELPSLIFALATIDEKQGNLLAAEKRYRRVLELTPDNPLPANNLAMLLIRTGKPDKEIMRLAEQARRILPHNAIVESTYGCALSHAGRDKDAIKILSDVIKATPKDAWAHYCIGKSLIKRKNSRAAQTHLEQVLLSDTQFPLREKVQKMLSEIR